MGTFGNFESTGERVRKGHIRLFSARRRDKPKGPDRYVLKLCRPRTDVVTEAEARTQTETFLDTARKQQMLASRSRHWAPVHEYGEVEGGAYAVSDLYARPVSWIIGKLQVSSKDLFRIIDAVVRGLRDLKEAYGRSHGNLHPGNILLSGIKSISRARVVLTDPLPSRLLKPDSHEMADLSAVGCLIYGLVVGRQFHGVLPREPAEVWTSLGKHGETWRALCCQLLESSATRVLVTLEDVEKTLGSMRPPKRRRRTWLIACLLAVLGGAGVGLFGWKTGRDWCRNEVYYGVVKPVLFPKRVAAWKSLCQQYESWFNWLVEQRTELKDKWRSDDKMPENLQDFLDSGQPSKDPGSLAERPGASIAELLDPLPAVATAREQEKLIRDTGEYVAGIKQALTTYLDTRLGDAKKYWNKGRWPAIATLTRNNAERLEEPETFASAVKSAVRLTLKLPDWDSRYKKHEQKYESQDVALGKLASLPKDNALLKASLDGCLKKDELSSADIEDLSKAIKSALESFKHPPDSSPAYNEWKSEIEVTYTDYEIGTNSTVLNERWHELRDKMLAGIQDASKWANDAGKRTSLENEVEALKTFLKGMDDIGSLPLLPDSSGDFTEEDKGAFNIERERVLTSALKRITWEGVVPEIAGFEVPDTAIGAFKNAERWKNLCSNYRDWLAEQVKEDAWKKALDLAKAALKKGRGWDELCEVSRYLQRALDKELKLDAKEMTDLLKELRPDAAKRAFAGLPIAADSHQFVTGGELAGLGDDRCWFLLLPRRVELQISTKEGVLPVGFVLVPPVREDRNPLYFGESEVCYGEYKGFSADVSLPKSSLHGAQEQHRPVAEVSYASAVRFCTWLSKRYKIEPLVYKCNGDITDVKAWTRDPESTGFRLPTEEEWIFALWYPDSPDSTPKIFADTAWFKEEGGASKTVRRRAAVTAGITPNPLGLYFMRGNLAELVTDIEEQSKYGETKYWEVVMGGRPDITQEEAKANGYRERLDLKQESREYVGFRLVLPLQLR